ncbi:MAG: hypothetical protein Q7U02_14655 [Desulfosalsimonadaceae bacterium]|nr:hypothetical protein [Desulfosalsimonadaceae bacterium]
MLPLLKNTKNLAWGMIFVMVLGLLMTVSEGFAKDAVMKVKEIKEPSALTGPVVKQEKPNQAAYHLQGTVNALGDNWITINDHQVFIAPDASLNCGVGDYVGIRLNDEGKAIVCEQIQPSN